MKCKLSIITCLCITIILSITSTSSSITSYLKIDIVEAVNIHCKLNNEFYCNPYAEIAFKYFSETKTSKSVECTKHPKWESSFIFTPETCRDIVYINLYQYLTPRDNAYLDTATNEDEDGEKGEYKPGYLGRVVLELEKIPHGMIDDWFMVDTPSENTRIIFPTCLHLRIAWTSALCVEPGDTFKYQIQTAEREEFFPKNFIPMCKKDFALVYKTKFSRIETEDPIKKKNEIGSKTGKDLSSLCKMDSNTDYGFLHKYSNLTSIEEALVYKIIKRTTGENINYEEFTNEYIDPTKDKKYVKSYKEFFSRECFRRNDMTIERVNNILKNDAENFPQNTTNYFLTHDLEKLNYSEKNNLFQLENVYKDTLNQFYAVEDIKSLDTMDDDSYVETMNKLTKVIKGIHDEKKIDGTLFEIKNKVLLTSEGLVNAKEELFFRIYALYKWNGGQYPYDEIKREFMLRRKYFDCYERVDMIPTNILLQFVDDVCPNNYVCMDPNGIVLNSVGRNPNEVFAKEIKETKLKFFEKSNNFNKNFKPRDKSDVNKNNINLRFRQNNFNKEHNRLNNLKDIISVNGNEMSSISDTKDSPFSTDNNRKINFEDLLKMEIILPSDNPDNIEQSEPKSATTFIKNDKTSNQIKINPYTTKITYKNKFDLMYEQRLIRIKKKKEVIINKVFNHIPLLGEILSIANLAVDRNYTNSSHDHFDEKFLTREKDLLKKYLLLYDSNIPFVEQAAKLLLDLILCNNDKTSIAYTLRELLEGLCYGDDRSIKIFEEIVRTVLIESLLLKPYFLFGDLHAKVNLLNTLNKPLCYKPITKIRFVEVMLMFDYVKEKITYILYDNDSNIKIARRIKETEDSIPDTLRKNKREFALAGNNFDNVNVLNKNYLDEMDRIKLEFEDRKKREKFEMENNINNGEFRFKSLKEDLRTNDGSDNDILNRIQAIRNILDSEIKNENQKENYSGIVVKDKLNLIKTNTNADKILNKSNLIKENKERSDWMHLNASLSVVKDDDLFGEFNDFIDVQKNDSYAKFGHKNKLDINMEEILIKNITKKDDYSHQLSSQEYNKTKHENIISNPNRNFYNKSTDAFPKFKSLNHNTENKQYSSEDNNEFANQSLNQFNNKNNYPDDKSYSILSTNKQPSSEDILNKVMEDKNSKNLIEKIQSNPNSKIIFPQEIHTIYEVGKQGTKQITVNNNHPTKKLIIEKLMDENSYNDLMNQEEKKVEDNEQTGLFNVLKNIQNRKCSFEFLCIEIGTIYGPFDDLKPKEVTIMTKQKENVHVIIKPIIMINNTEIPKEIKTKPQKDLFDVEEDCDILKISNEKDKSIYSANTRFKQIVDRDAKQTKLKRKFYRKVEMGNEILATEIFKQGLNMIIFKREKDYPKIFERTYNTNTDPIESDAMACVLRDSGYDKIIVITGIGKWMGSITPRLVKEIKQIGGPNLNYLVTSDGEDNSMADHAFILIGRRGLCRYNGIFRIKNYDVSKDMKKYFSDLSSDPNDCYFDDISFENEKNKNHENKFFHLIDLRLTLDLSNDSRFSSKAPVITTSFPNSGPINGGQIVKIRGFNFGKTSLDIKEVLIRGVICKNVALESPFLITCVTGSSTIMGPGVGNIQVKLLCGLSSPQATCNMYQYTSDVKLEETGKITPEETQSNNNFNSKNDVDVLEGVGVIDRPLLPPSPHLISIDHPPLLPAYPMIDRMQLPHPIPAPGIAFSHSLFANQPNLFSFKEKQTKKEEKDDDTKLILENFNTDNSKNHNMQKIDNLVTDNYKEILSHINSSSFTTPRDGLRKRRFTNIFEKLK